MKFGTNNCTNNSSHWSIFQKDCLTTSSKYLKINVLLLLLGKNFWVYVFKKNTVLSLSLDMLLWMMKNMPQNWELYLGICTSFNLITFCFVLEVFGYIVYTQLDYKWLARNTTYLMIILSIIPNVVLCT